MKRQFILSLDYKSDVGTWDTTAHDTIEASNLMELVSKFNLLLVSLHQRILKEERSGEIDDDIPF